MKRTKTKILSVFLSVCMIISCMVGISVTASATPAETLLTTLTFGGSSTYSETTRGVVSVTATNVMRYDSTYGWLWFEEGSLSVTAKEGYTITKCVFIQNAKTPITDTEAPFEIHSNSRGKITEDASMRMDGVTSIEVYGTSAHTHSFTYSATGATITATCSAADCSLTGSKATLTLVKPTLTTYGGTGDATATLTGLDAFNAATGLNVGATDIKYYEAEEIIPGYKRAGGELAQAPTDVGEYFVGLTLSNVKISESETEDVKVYVPYTISKGAPTITIPPTASAITYGEKLSDSTLSGGEASVPGTFSWKTPTTAPAVSDSDTTEYAVVFTPTDSTSYSAVETTVTLTVNKADPTAPTGLTAKTGQTLADVALPDGWEWTDAGTTSVGAVGENKFKANYTPTGTDATNYNSKTDVELTVKVSAATVAVTGVTLDKTTAEIEVGKTETLTATVTPANATDKTVTWTSSDTSIATVANGVVTAVGAGTVTITAKAGGKSATCTVTVKSVSPAPEPEPTPTPDPTPYMPTYIPTTATTTTATTPAIEIKKYNITGKQDAQNVNALTWDAIPEASAYSLYIMVDGKYVFVQGLGEATKADVVHATNGKYYVSTGGDYTIYEYDSKTGKFTNTGTLEASKIENVKKANNVTEDFMVTHTVNGTESTENNSYKVSVNIYYKPALSITAGKGFIRVNWAKVPGAEKYRAYKVVNGKLKFIIETDKLALLVNGTKAGRKYAYAVKAFVDGEWTTVYKSDVVRVTAK